jgi:uncharacterized protein
MKKYYERLVDKELKLALESMGAVLIEGPKWCGKTTTALQHCKSVLRMQEPANMVNNLLIADTAPSLLLEGERPRLIDEWQTAPILWDAIRTDIDNTGRKGQYVLTGSTTPLQGSTMHSGTGRIARLKMYPMSLFESQDSSGMISLKCLFENKVYSPVKSTKTIEDIAYLICRGGWPQSINSSIEQAIYTVNQYVQSIYNNDINELGDTKTDPHRVESFLKSYSRNVQTLTNYKTILEDMKANDIGITAPTLYSYMEKMQRLFVIEETHAWAPNIRSKTSIRTSNKRGFVDPSIPVAVLNITPPKLLKDFELFGFLFESMCIRDLRIYANTMGGRVLHYRDDSGLECDAVILLPSGEYALVEIKLGGKQEETAVENLNKLEELLGKMKSKPIFKMILTGGSLGYTRLDGIHVIPITCFRE